MRAVDTKRVRLQPLELATSVKANVREANVMPELKQAARLVSKGFTV
jgi:hypothetical protein